MRAIHAVLSCLLFAFAAAASAAPRVLAIPVDGMTREALVFEPAAATAEPRPLVLAFHGHGANMRAFAKLSELHSRWPQAIVVYPQGLPTPSKGDPAGRKPGWQVHGADDRDLKFVDALLRTLRRDYRIDERRIFATGFSNGAAFALRLWRERGETFAGFGIVAGAQDARFPLAEVEATIAEERRAAGASATGEACGEGCRLYRGGEAEVKVVVHPGGHVYPPQAAELTIDFFRSLRFGAEAERGGGMKGDIVQYPSQGRELIGLLYKPPGDGPFPVYLWNHGSEHDPPPGARLAQFWVPHGFVLFAPLRSGHGPNPGPWIGDEQQRIVEPQSAAGFRELIALHERANDDVIAAVRWIARQPYVDRTRIVVAGGSAGAVQALLTAERDAREHLGVHCVVAMAPAAEAWSNPHWAERLGRAIDAAHAPIFLLQAANDYSTGPSEVLGPRLDAKGAPNRHRLFPAHGAAGEPAQGHAGFFADPAAWGEDVLAFLHDCGAR